MAMTPAEFGRMAKAIIKDDSDKLHRLDQMLATQNVIALRVAGAKDVKQENCLTFIIGSSDSEDHGYVYGPGETLVSEEPQTQEELVEQIGHFTEMQRRMRSYGGLKQ